MLGEIAWLEEDGAGDILVFGAAERRGLMRWLGARRVRVGRLSPEVSRTVRPFLQGDRRYRVRLVDVPGPGQVGGPISISIWAQADGDRRSRVDAPRPLPRHLQASF